MEVSAVTHRFKRTFEESRREILSALRSAGWVVKSELKIPHATSPDGELRLWFKAQAVHSTEGNRHEFGNARTFGGYGFDIREYDGPEFLAVVERLRRL